MTGYYIEPRKRKYVSGYGKMFKEYDLNVQQQKTTCLQSGLSFENLGIEDNDDVNDDKLAQTTNEIITLAAEKSPETFYLIKITKEYDTKDYDDTDNMVTQ